MFIEYDDTQYHEGILIDEYNGEYSLVLANEGKDGKIYKKWCYPKKPGKDAGASEHLLPWKIKLGNSAESAVAMLSLLADKLRNDAGIPVDDGGEDIPF